MKARKPRETKAGNGAAARAGKARRPEVKRGPGRPPRTVERERVVVLLPGDLKAKLKHAAVDEKRELSAIVADALTAYFARQGARNE